MDKLIKQLGIDETLTKPQKKQKIFNKVDNNIPMMPNYYDMLDLLHLPTTKQGYRYLVTIVDLATRKCDFEPIKTKTADEIKSAVETIFKRQYVKIPYASIRTDDGNEFKGSFDKYLYKNNILHKMGSPYRHTQNAVVEALNKQIARLLNGYMNKKEIETNKIFREWTDILPTIRKGLNDFRTRKITPDHKYPTLNPQKPPLFKVGDIVRYKLDRPENALGHAQPTTNFRVGDNRYSYAPKKIVKLIYFLDEPYYRYLLEGIDNVSYCESQLIKATGQTDTKYIVKDIINKRKNKNIIEYLVHWKGYKKAESTWEPEKELIKDGLKDLIDEYNKNP